MKPAQTDLQSLPCRSCGKPGLQIVLSLGRTPLANSLLSAEQLKQPEPTFPLDLAFCPSCTLLQITHSVPPERLFRDYVYFSSISDTMLKHAEKLARELIKRRELSDKSLVIEIASNDGYLLQFYRRNHIPVLGIEPARNIAEVAERERGVPTLCEFFTLDLARQLHSEWKQADVIHAHNVLAHVPDLNGFIAGMRELLSDDGLIVIEVPYALDMIERCEFDTIYHEHLCYFSITALNEIFSRHGLALTEAENVPIHGGSLRLFVTHAGNTLRVGSSVSRLLEQEREWGVFEISRYQHFASQVDTLSQRLRALLTDLRQQGKRIAAYGASAKGSTLLNYLRLPAGTLEFVVDRSTFKQGRFTPGMHLQIFSPQRLLESMPDCVLM